MRKQALYMRPLGTGAVGGVALDDGPENDTAWELAPGLTRELQWEAGCESVGWRLALGSLAGWEVV